MYVLCVWVCMCEGVLCVCVPVCVWLCIVCTVCACVCVISHSDPSLQVPGSQVPGDSNELCAFIFPNESRKLASAEIHQMVRKI